MRTPRSGLVGRLSPSLAAVALLASAAALADSARLDYLLHCTGCHLADGSGAPGKVPSLRERLDDFVQVEGGRAFLAQVPGASQSALSDARLAGVLNWMLEAFGDVPADFEPYTAEEVGRYRQDALVNVAATRETLVQRMTARD